MANKSTATASWSNLIRRWGSVIAGLAGLIGLTWYIMRYKSEFYRLRETSVVNILILSLIILLGHLVVALKFRLMTETFGSKLTLGEAFSLAEAGGFLNIVPLNLGTGFRAAYLKKVRGLKLVDFGLGSLGNALVGFVASGFIGLFFCSVISCTSAGLYLLFSIYILIPVGLVILALLVNCSPRLYTFARRNGQGRWGKFLGAFLLGLRVLLGQPQGMLQWFALSLLGDLVLGIRYWAVATWLGYPVGFASGMVLQSVARAATAITIMPSGTVGLREMLTGLGTLGLEGSVVSGVMISTVDRIVATAWLVLLGTVSLFVLRHRMLQLDDAGTLE